MSWEMCPQAEMNIQRHHVGRTCWRGFIWCFQTALGSVLQEPFWFSFFVFFLCFKTHGFLLKHPAKRKSKSKLQMNYAIIFSLFLSLYLTYLYLSLSLRYLPPPTHTDTLILKIKHSASVCVSTEIAATVNSQDLWNHIPRMWDHKLC